MLLKNEDLNELDKSYRIKLINSITGIKPANLIATKSAKGVDNVAIFSSVVHIGSSPALIGFVMRPQTPDYKDTYLNIHETEYYTINQVATTFIDQAHKTAAKVASENSEFELFGIEKEEINSFFAPFVKASPIKMGLRHAESLHLPNGCIFIIGEVVLINIADDIVDNEGRINLETSACAGISGLESYYALTHVKTCERPD